MEINDDLQNLPKLIVADDEEVMMLIDRHALFGRGIGHIDEHLLTSVRLTADASLWTRDKRLCALAMEIGIGFRPPPSLSG